MAEPYLGQPLIVDLAILWPNSTGSAITRDGWFEGTNLRPRRTVLSMELQRKLALALGVSLELSTLQGLAFSGQAKIPKLHEGFARYEAKRGESLLSNNLS